VKVEAAPLFLLPRLRCGRNLHQGLPGLENITTKFSHYPQFPRIRSFSTAERQQQQRLLLLYSGLLTKWRNRDCTQH